MLNLYPLKKKKKNVYTIRGKKIVINTLMPIHYILIENALNRSSNYLSRVTTL